MYVFIHTYIYVSYIRINQLFHCSNYDRHAYRFQWSCPVENGFSNPTVNTTDRKFPTFADPRYAIPTIKFTEHAILNFFTQFCRMKFCDEIFCGEILRKKSFSVHPIISMKVTPVLNK